MKERKFYDSAEALKKRGHGVIEESKWENFDKMVDNNCKSYMGLRYVNNVLLLCEIMHNEAMPLADRRRQAYDKFQEFDCNGTSAHMICGALRDLCTDGETLVEEILDFKYTRTAACRSAGSTVSLWSRYGNGRGRYART